jgi:hypothetical protein
MGEDFERWLAVEYTEWIDADQLTELPCEEGELRETAYGEESLENKFFPRVRWWGETIDGGDSFSFLDRESIEAAEYICTQRTRSEKRHEYLLIGQEEHRETAEHISTRRTQMEVGKET